MSEIRNLIADKIVNPASRNGQPSTLIARVLEADETNNWCSLEYVDKDGFSRNRDNVLVMQYGASRWFPKVKDLVIIEDRGESVIIVSKSFTSYSVEIKEKETLRKDVYPDQFGASVGGVII